MSAHDFETAFFARLKQSPGNYICAKLKSGTNLETARYVFDVVSAAIAQEYGCQPVPFDFYYPKGASPVSKIPHYNKLVRDRIPDIIEGSGKHCTVEVLDEKAYLDALDAKLQEELNEYQESHSLEELADLLEVMGAVVKARGYTWDDLTRVRKAKRAKRGGFDRRLLLKDVTGE